MDSFPTQRNFIVGAEVKGETSIPSAQEGEGGGGMQCTFDLIYNQQNFQLESSPTWRKFQF